VAPRAPDALGEARDQHEVDGADHEDEDRERDVDDDEVREHLLSALALEATVVARLVGRDAEDGADVVGGSNRVGHQRDHASDLGRPDPLLEPFERLLDVRTPLDVPPDLVDLLVERANVRVPDPVEARYDGDARPLFVPAIVK
jgi:hypothetical protein